MKKYVVEEVDYSYSNRKILLTICESKDDAIIFCKKMLGERLEEAGEKNCNPVDGGTNNIFGIVASICIEEVESFNADEYVKAGS
jgi:hypothetical protein